MATFFGTLGANHAIIGAQGVNFGCQKNSIFCSV